jgi:hypothetical protein
MKSASEVLGAFSCLRLTASPHSLMIHQKVKGNGLQKGSSSSAKKKKSHSTQEKLNFITSNWFRGITTRELLVPGRLDPGASAGRCTSPPKYQPLRPHGSVRPPHEEGVEKSPLPKGPVPSTPRAWIRPALNLARPQHLRPPPARTP